MMDFPKYSQPARITVEFLDDDSAHTVTIECDHLDMVRHRFVQVTGEDDDGFTESRACGCVSTLVAYNEPAPLKA